MTTTTLAGQPGVDGALVDGALGTADPDPLETQEWREAVDSLLEFEGSDRAEFILAQVLDHARAKGASMPYSANTPYLNTIAPDRQKPHPGDLAIEHAIRSLTRWNAAAMVLRANKESSE